jgi:NADPH:quinone reductase
VCPAGSAEPTSRLIESRAVRALQVKELSGPDGVELVDISEPEPSHMLTPGEAVVIEVAASAVSFPDVLQSRGLYQFKPDPPFVPGAEVAGVVRSAPDGAGVSAGDRVAAMTMLGGWADIAVAPPHMTFPLADQLDFAEGAALVLNYHTAYFSLKMRGRLAEGESVLVHGAAGGVGTATLQVAKGLGASTVAVVSSDEKEEIARSAGADEVVRSDGPWREEVQELTDGGVDVVVDPVGGDRFTDSLRSLREEGRVVVVGFTEGSIPEVKVNRLLLRNTEVVGAGWGAFVMPKPDVVAGVASEIDGLIADGAIRPIVGSRFPLAEGADAMRLIDERRATGKVVLDVG